jgi:hypothetical protein
MLLCHVYGDLKSGAMVRTVCAGSGTAPEKTLSAVTPLVGLVMKSERPLLTNVAATRWL